jgi:hypothetical protein
MLRRTYDTMEARMSWSISAAGTREQTRGSVETATIPDGQEQQGEAARRFVLDMLDTMPDGDSHRFSVSAGGHHDPQRANVSITMSCGPV